MVHQIQPVKDIHDRYFTICDLSYHYLITLKTTKYNGPNAQFGFESIEKQLWRDKQSERLFFTMYNRHVNGPYAPFGFESTEKQLWRNKQNDRPISDSEIKAVLSQLFQTDQWLPPAGHLSEDVTSHA
ncbi:hypothetical protein AVEN_182046-1 [Araneus ventricosus]|uniref:Uncharacterized protein n=1 Tax=Araneus ventricosus TaxID=182803 RepID=A0A4Y2M8R0_ARAVE|nr:hypothetical protein AVEN_182046-1 [Araneus ventricosus]